MNGGMNPYGMGGMGAGMGMGMGGGMGMMGMLGGMGGGGGGNSGSREAANEITKLGAETSKGLQENLKTFQSGQEKGLQTFFNSLKESQPKEDNSKLLESLSKASQGGGGESASTMGAITDNVVKAIDEDSKTQIEAIGMIGKSMMKTPAMQIGPQQQMANANSLPPGSRSPLNQLMGLSGTAAGTNGSSTGLPSFGSHPRAVRGAYKSPE